MTDDFHEFTDSAGHTHAMAYRRCRCNVWEVSILFPVGRCRFCGERPTEPATHQDWLNR